MFRSSEAHRRALEIIAEDHASRGSKYKAQLRLRQWAFTFGQMSIELYVALICISVGLPILFSKSFAPQSVLSTYPTWIVYSFAWVLVLGGAVWFAGLISKAYYIQRAGLVLLGGGLSILIIAIILARGSAGITAIMTYGFLSLAALARYYALGVLIKAETAINNQVAMDPSILDDLNHPDVGRD